MEERREEQEGVREEKREGEEGEGGRGGRPEGPGDEGGGGGTGIPIRGGMDVDDSTSMSSSVANGANLFLVVTVGLDLDFVFSLDREEDPVEAPFGGLPLDPFPFRRFVFFLFCEIDMALGAATVVVFFTADA